MNMNENEVEHLPIFSAIAGPSRATKRSAKPAKGEVRPKTKPKKAKEKKGEKNLPKKRITRWPATPQLMINMFSGKEIKMPPNDFQPDTIPLPKPQDGSCVCSICGETKKDFKQLIYHWPKHTPGFHCTICIGVQFETQLELTLHFMQHGDYMECPVCISNYFTDPAKYYHHLKYECGPKNWKYQCKYCLCTFAEGYYLNDHNCLEKMYANQKKYRQRKEYQKRKKIQDAIKFENSNDSKVTYWTLPEVPDDLTVPTKRLPSNAANLACAVCGVKKDSAKDILNHWVAHNYNQRYIKTFRCTICKNVKVNNEIELLLHFTRHGVPQKCPYECFTPPFSNVKDMLLHVKQCQPRKWQFKCMYCNRKCPLEGGHDSCKVRQAAFETKRKEREKQKKEELQWKRAEKRLMMIQGKLMVVSNPVVQPKKTSLREQGERIGANVIAKYFSKPTLTDPAHRRQTILVPASHVTQLTWPSRHEQGKEVGMDLNAKYYLKSPIEPVQGRPILASTRRVTLPNLLSLHEQGKETKADLNAESWSNPTSPKTTQGRPIIVPVQRMTRLEQPSLPEQRKEIRTDLSAEYYLKCPTEPVEDRPIVVPTRHVTLPKPLSLQEQGKEARADLIAKSLSKPSPEPPQGIRIIIPAPYAMQPSLHEQGKEAEADLSTNYYSKYITTKLVQGRPILVPAQRVTQMDQPSLHENGKETKADLTGKSWSNPTSPETAQGRPIVFPVRRMTHMEQPNLYDQGKRVRAEYLPKLIGPELVQGIRIVIPAPRVSFSNRRPSTLTKPVLDIPIAATNVIKLSKQDLQETGENVGINRFENFSKSSSIESTQKRSLIASASPVTRVGLRIQDEKPRVDLIANRNECFSNLKQTTPIKLVQGVPIPARCLTQSVQQSRSEERERSKEDANPPSSELNYSNADSFRLNYDSDTNAYSAESNDLGIKPDSMEPDYFRDQSPDTSETMEYGDDFHLSTFGLL